MKLLGEINKMENNYRFFSNNECKYFPCHNNMDSSHFNCLFCYCPLFYLGAECGGNFKYIGENNTVKNCSNCNLPHHPEYYDVIINKLKNR